MGAIRDVLRGLGGSLAVALPLVLAWAGVLCVGAARGMRVSAFRVIADVLLIVCLFTAVHVFFAGRIEQLAHRCRLSVEAAPEKNRRAGALSVFFFFFDNYST